MELFSIRIRRTFQLVSTSGEYDFGNGEWNNKYIVTDLLESGSMIWTAKDNENDVNKYIRCEKVPENIIAEAKVDKGE